MGTHVPNISKIRQSTAEFLRGKFVALVLTDKWTELHQSWEH